MKRTTATLAWLLAALTLVIAACDSTSTGAVDAPTVGIEGIALGASVPPNAALTIRVESRATLAELSAAIAGTELMLDPQAVTSLTLDAFGDLADGEYTLTIVATDDKTNTTEQTVSFNVAQDAVVGDGGSDDVTGENPDIQVGFVAPAANATVSGTIDIVVLVEARDVAVERFSLSADGVILDGPVTKETLARSGDYARTRYTYAWDTTVHPDGPIILTATATSADGEVSGSTELALAVGTGFEIINPLSDDEVGEAASPSRRQVDVLVGLFGTVADAITRVEILVGAQPIGEALFSTDTSGQVTYVFAWDTCVTYTSLDDPTITVHDPTIPGDRTLTARIESGGSTFLSDGVTVNYVGGACL